MTDAEASVPVTTLRSWLDAHAELAMLDRELLLCHELGIDRAVLIATPERRIEANLMGRLENAARRLAAGEPLAYLTGECGFWDFSLHVSPAVLIPRPETETLVEQALTKIRPRHRVLDLGTGSGAIAIALARSAGISVLAVDQSESALRLAARNAARLKARVGFRQSNWFENVPERFNVIVANPPYVAAGDRHLAALAHEPRHALVSGAEGLDDLTRIIRAAPTHLEQGGWLLVEHGYDQAPPVAELFRHAAFDSVQSVRDLGGQPRVTLGRRGKTDEC